VFQDGSVLGKIDLNNEVTQLLYIAQEAFDQSASAILKNGTTNFDATNKNIQNVLDPVLAQDAATKNYVDAKAIAAGNVVPPGASTGSPSYWLKALSSTTWGWARSVIADISDATAFGKSLLSLSSAAAAQQTLAQGPVLILTQTGSGVSSIDFTSGIDSTYNEYVFVLSGILPSANLAVLQARISTDAGVTWKSGATDYSRTFSMFSTANTTTQSSSSEPAMVLASGPGGLSNNTGRPLVGEVRLFNPAGGTLNPFVWDLSVNDAANLIRHSGTGMYTAGTPTNGVRFFMSSGTLSGTISLYGIRK
jgi:hypothetical protein